MSQDSSSDRCPANEAVWLGFGEIAMLPAGGWVLLARLSGLEGLGSFFFRHITGERGITIARIIFGLALLPVGLSHIFDVGITASLVPSWLPFRVGLAYLTGVGQMACGLGVLFSVFPRAAALIETGMLAVFCLPFAGPGQMDRFQSKNGRDTCGTEISPDGIFHYLGHWRFRSLGRDQHCFEMGPQLKFFAKQRERVDATEE
jgi:uncharacterized membrane protein YphA (DoxX/SURF4 family)